MYGQAGKLEIIGELIKIYQSFHISTYQAPCIENNNCFVELDTVVGGVRLLARRDALLFMSSLHMLERISEIKPRKKLARYEFSFNELNMAPLNSRLIHAEGVHNPGLMSLQFIYDVLDQLIHLKGKVKASIEKLKDDRDGNYRFIAIAASVIALFISLFNAWLSYNRK